MGGGEGGRSAAAACRTHGKIRAAPASIDPVKIGLHLRLSLRRRLFVCIDKSCDLADGTLCLLSIQRGGGGGGRWEEEGVEVRKRRRRINNSAAKSTSSSQASLFYVLDKPGEKLDLFVFGRGGCHLIHRGRRRDQSNGS